MSRSAMHFVQHAAVRSLAVKLGAGQRWLLKQRHGFKKISLAIALALFCGGLYASLRAQPDMLRDLQWGPIFVIFFVTLPAGLALGAADFKIFGILVGAQIPFLKAVQVIILTRAANMLPIPGSFVVRSAVLKLRGVTVRRSGALMIVFTLAWGGMGFLFSCLWLLIRPNLLVASAFAVTGFLLLTAAFFILKWLSQPGGALVRICLIRLGIVAVDAFSLMFALHAVGVEADYEQTGILVAAGFAAFLLPAGIGIREAAIAALSPMAGIDFASGFFAASISRFTGMAFLALSAMAYALVERGDGGEP